MMKRISVLIYGVVVYAAFFATFLYLIGFTGNLLVPKGINGPLQVPILQAVLTNALLILFFGVQHSLMARTWFKKWWLKFIPESMERSTYVLFTVVALVTLFTFWQPMGITIWNIEEGMLYGSIMALFALGWTIVLISTFMINHFDLFGLRQVWLYFKGKEYEPLKFRIHIFYKFVRHPLYFGFLLALWAAPEMTITRLILAIGLTIYILMAIQWEEKDLIQHFGEKYRQYCDSVPMIIPSFMRKKQVKANLETIVKGGKTSQ